MWTFLKYFSYCLILAHTSIFSQISLLLDLCFLFPKSDGFRGIPSLALEKKKKTQHTQSTPSKESCLTSVITPYNLDLSEMKYQTSKKHLNSILWCNIVKGWLISFCAVRFCIDPLNNEHEEVTENSFINFKRGKGTGGKIFVRSLGYTKVRSFFNQLQDK